MLTSQNSPASIEGRFLIRVADKMIKYMIHATKSAVDLLKFIFVIVYYLLCIENELFIEYFF